MYINELALGRLSTLKGERRGEAAAPPVGLARRLNKRAMYYEFDSDSAREHPLWKSNFTEANL
jgi:hypothetical protein